MGLLIRLVGGPSQVADVHGGRRTQLATPQTIVFWTGFKPLSTQDLINSTHHKSNRNLSLMVLTKDLRLLDNGIPNIGVNFAIAHWSRHKG